MWGKEVSHVVCVGGIGVYGGGVHLVKEESERN